jgi:hypothetical protein
MKQRRCAGAAACSPALQPREMGTNCQQRHDFINVRTAPRRAERAVSGGLTPAMSVSMSSRHSAPWAGPRTTCLRCWTTFLCRVHVFAHVSCAGPVDVVRIRGRAAAHRLSAWAMCRSEGWQAAGQGSPRRKPGVQINSSTDGQRRCPPRGSRHCPSAPQLVELVGGSGLFLSRWER